MLNTNFPPWPSFTEEEADAIHRVLLSNKVNYWTGEETRKFEQEFAAFADCEHAVALANGTLALDLALKALEIGPGDEVIVTPRTFIASISSVVTAGARPVFADVDQDSQNLSASTIEAVITPATRAVIVVHLAGMPADMDPILALAKSHGLHVIEDCAQAHGARYKGRSVGSMGDIAAWSFCQDKIMTTGGEGGMVTTNNRELWSRMWSYKDHGKSWEAVYERQHPPGYRWLHDSFGTNWRMTELQGVLGRIQLLRMTKWGAVRRANAERIWATCGKMSWLRVPEIPEHVVHGAYKAYVFVRPEKLPAGWNRDEILLFLNERGVPAFSGSCSEVYLEKAFEGTGFRPANRLPVAKALGETSVMFLVHPTLEESHMTKTCEAMEALNEQVKSFIIGRSATPCLRESSSSPRA
ncbi:DegT/DnrJ/EryC1/StrS family aminotransferase [Granulosicoccus sp. 3-233]|uniref:DegT/DnrJ/EryC1/StrS family aminotransferase n=1 Tax=Granulosicoccus sp. 3-233 TaxID=3417969 RepID=UPI003D355C52